MMRILLYNYVQPGEYNNPGGGVNIYLANLMRDLRAAGHEVLSMSSGDRYDLVPRAPRIRVDRKRNQVIVYNSPVIAPGIFSFHHPEIFAKSHDLDQVPDMLFGALGSLDVIHFHNIEGLTRAFFHALRRRFPGAAILYSAHNYSSICPAINLWNRNSRTCSDFQNGLACTSCWHQTDSLKRKILSSRLKTLIKDMDENALKRIVYRVEQAMTKTARRMFIDGEAPISDPGDSNVWLGKAGEYRGYRSGNIELLNSVFDKTIAVSKRTGELLVNAGADEKRIQVSYIGTRHYSKFGQYAMKSPTPGSLHLAYIGYMRKEKGFYYFLGSLERLPPETLSAIDITVAAKFTDASALQRLEVLRKSARSVNLHDGYSQANLPEILSDVNLGIVPPLWEDNLPQVAIEFVCHGIPILTSTMGGAQEIADRPEFAFDVSNADGLSDKLTEIATGRLEMGTFWNHPLNLRSTSQHAAEMLGIYAAVRARAELARVTS